MARPDLRFRRYIPRIMYLGVQYLITNMIYCRRLVKAQKEPPAEFGLAHGRIVRIRISELD